MFDIEIEMKGRTAMGLASIVAVASVTILALPALAGSIEIPTPSEIATWPAQVLLALVALGAMWVAYKTWLNSMASQKETNIALTQIAQSIAEQVHEMRRSNDLLAERPCILDKNNDA